MPRTKKRKSLTQNAVQFARSFNKNKKWRGKANPVKVKSGQKPKKIWQKIQNKIVYRDKIEN